MGELIFELVLAAVLLAFMVFGLQIPAMSSPNDIVEASGFPLAFSLIALILLAAEIYGHIRGMKKQKGEEDSSSPAKMDLKQAYKVVIIIGMTVAYLLFAKYMGFVVFSVVFAFIALNLLGSKKQVFNVIFAVIAALLLTLIFGRFFGIVLPRGQGILKSLSFYLY